MMPTVGRVGMMMQQMKLQMQWAQRKQNPMKKPKTEETPEQRELRRLREQAAQTRKSNIILGIDAKLKSGQTLSADELEYLKVNNPELYKEAIEVMQEREQYRKELERCQTQDEVQRLNTSRMQQFVSAAKSISSNANIPLGAKAGLLDKICRRMMGIQSEHNKFVSSSRYQQLPKEEELRNKKKRPAESSESQPELPEKTPKPPAGEAAEEPDVIIPEEKAPSTPAPKGEIPAAPAEPVAQPSPQVRVAFSADA